jgi:glycosyltransferase involved in cell wall biosynthesis
VTPVLFIAYHFPPVGGAGVQRTQSLVRNLPAEGFMPNVVTGPGPAEDRWTPHDATLSEGLPDGINIFRAAGPIPRSDGGWNARLERWFALPDAFSKWWVQAATGTALQSVGRTKLIFATMSPFATAEAARKISLHTGIPWIADLRDPWALDEIQIYPSALHRKIELNRMGRLLSAAAGIVMNTPEATAALRKAFPSLRQRLVKTITNGYEAEDFSGAIPPRMDGKFRIVHTGYLHTDFGLQIRRKRNLYRLLGGIETDVDILTRSHVILLRAIEKWLVRRPEVAQNLEVVFAGVATELDKRVVADSAVSKFVQFRGYLTHSASVALVRTADLLFLPMHNLPEARRSRIVPGKTYEYMASGRPILAAVPEGDARDFLKQSGLALLSKPDDVDGMAEKLDHVNSAWKNGASVTKPDWDFIARFSRAKLTRDLAEFFRKVLEEQGSLNCAS